MIRCLQVNWRWWKCAFVYRSKCNALFYNLSSFFFLGGSVVLRPTRDYYAQTAKSSTPLHKVFEQRGIFIVPRLLWHGTSVFAVSRVNPLHCSHSRDKHETRRTCYNPDCVNCYHRYSLKLWKQKRYNYYFYWKVFTHVKEAKIGEQMRNTLSWLSLSIFYNTFILFWFLLLCLWFICVLGG